MLAHQHGLALITEKLQNQRLEEPAGGSSGVVPSAGSSTSSSFCGKLPAVSQDSFLISDHPGQSATALSVKGKNVWTLSLEADRISQHGGHQTDTTSGSPSTLHHTSSSPRSIMPSVCRHKKLRHLCQICDTAPGTPSAPPKKKHCRSLSVPPDGPSTPTFFPSGKDSSSSPCTRFSIGIGGHGGAYSSHHHHHHHQSSGHHASNSKIWRPIAVVPLRGSPQTGGSNSANSSGSSKMTSSSKTKGGKEKISTSTGLHHHHHHHHHQYHYYPPASFSHAVSATMDADSMNNNDIGSSSISTSVSGNYEHNNNNVDSVEDSNKIASLSSRFSSCSSSSLLKHKLMPPSSSSSASFDSGHFTTSDLQTPPSSPIPQPRPASAASDASYSSIGWFDFSPMRGRLNILQNRSLSCEDRISACCSCCSSSSPFSCSSSSTSAGTTTSMPSVYNYNSSNKNATTFSDCDNNVDAGSVRRAGVRGSGRGSAATCCSHHSVGGGIGEVVPRCHSQPCVLHHRRYGKKRRRECDRPTLNFNKMTETAYVPPHPHRRSEPWSSPSFDAQMRSLQGHYAFNTSGQNQQNLFSLNPIASSPSDTSEPLMSRHHSRQQQQSVSGARIDPGSERQGHFLETNMTINLTPPEASPGRRGLEEGNEEEEEEEEEDDDEDERNCSCHDNQKESDSIGVFPMGDLEDLDLEQIETH